MLTRLEAQSKRVVASHRYKIQKKVADHHRKARKEAKKNPQRRALKKDPGIPNLFPFKEKLLLQAEEAKKKAADEKKKIREARQQQSSLSGFEQMAADAAKRAVEFDSIVSGSSQTLHLQEAAVHGKDNSRKAYYKEFKKVVEAADVILEILDARDPLGCRTRQIEEMILNSGLNKRIILLVNKIDLIPREVAEQWLKYLRNEFPTIAFKASTQSQRHNLGQSSMSVDIAPENLLNSSECLGADNLMKLLKNYCRSNNLKTSITVGVVGYPNVGKSSVINSLKRSKVCNVGSTPGVTKFSQLVHLDKNIKLMDCPGIVFGKSSSKNDEADVILRNCIKVELLEDPILPVEAIVSRCDREQLMQLYGVPFFSTAKDFLLQVAMTRGKLKRGGIPDLENAARSVLQDWNHGRIPYYTVPPAAGVAVEAHISSAIVQSWSKEFCLPEIVATEGKELVNVKGRSEISHRMLVMQPGQTSNLEMDVDQYPPQFRMEEEVDMME